MQRQKLHQIVCYNPKKKQGTAYQREVAQRAKIISMSTLDHPNVLTGKDVIPGVGTRTKIILRTG